MSGNRTAIVLFTLLLMFQFSVCQVYSESITISPFAGIYHFEGNQDIDYDFTFGLGLGYNLNKSIGIETKYTFGRFEFKDDTEYSDNEEFDIQMIQLDLLYNLDLFDCKLVPYVAAGFGYMAKDCESLMDEETPFFNYGAGINYFINDNMALRADVRHVLDYNDESNNEIFNNLTYTVGFTYLIGKKSLKVPQTLNIFNNDSDSDGVENIIDKCPETPYGIKVNQEGCPLDSDRDGVYDYMDKCPDTSRFVKVDFNGCPILDDSDNDGIYDDKDQCADTPAGVEVNVFGCWVVNLRFDTGNSNVKPSMYKELNKVVTILKNYPHLKIEIQGHTDNVGKELYNSKLSLTRARAVMNYLIKKGISKKRLQAYGYGHAKPIASNDTPEGRALNRRVQLQTVR